VIVLYVYKTSDVSSGTGIFFDKLDTMMWSRNDFKLTENCSLFKREDNKRCISVIS